MVALKRQMSVSQIASGSKKQERRGGIETGGSGGCQLGPAPRSRNAVVALKPTCGTSGRAKSI